MRNGTIRFSAHTKEALCHSWVNVLLVFVPVGIAVKAAGLSPAIVFAMNAVAIIPLAGLLSHATESVASRLGDTIGALINVTFGNAVELIIFIIALAKNQIRIVQASLLGSILANLLLILGMAFLLGGLRFQEQVYNNTVTQMSAVVLSLAASSLLLPTAFHASFNDSDRADLETLKVSRGTSVVLLLVYILYIIFQLKSHAYLYASVPQRIIDEESHPGVLAEFLDSSDSSSSSSDESDNTTASRSTAKRIRQAISNRRRRKSSTSTTSKGTASRQSIRKQVMINETQGSVGNSIGSNNSVAMADDEVHYDADNDLNNASTEFRSRDFGQALSRSGTAQSEPPKRHRKKHRSKRAEKAADKAQAQAQAQVNPQMQAANVQGARPSMTGAASFPNFAGMSGAGENEAQRKWSPFGPIPSLLSNTVFSSQSPANSPHLGPGAGPKRPGMARSNSLPARVSRSPHVGNAVQFARGAARVTESLDPVAPDQPAPTQVSEMSRTAAVVMLLLSTGLVAICAEFLVDAIPEMIASSPVSEAFIGLIILPIVGNAAEHVTAVSVAKKNKMDLSIGVSVGSSIQIAVFVTPLVVILGWIMDKDMSLYFTLFETVCLFVAVFVVNFLVLDGRSNYLEGALLMAAYIIIALGAFFYPNDPEAGPLAGTST
ncbi:hypothetical protein N7532_000994 [Penicillium argentinense]|uniref:Sodium/calcium exchanger membrane region domain-containing protein n=1 Tax=Penicillium argentinense TaxID=1131581 RepID=A0A9W9KKU6_9EURO|nr:uncharacterized protein N7532_000994 [Penicillium argentinense]KAJ5110459.1 hypothetical protein N7532_000994 [Penicillium argentinense]